MRRSKSSTSLIPLRTDGRRSSATAHRNAPVESKLKRSLSSEHMFQWGRPSGSGAAPGSGSASSRNSRTPQVRKSNSLSVPRSSVRKGKDQRPISDKGWQLEQHAKVKGYFNSKGFAEIANNLKPPTLNNFVFAVSALFERIDPRLAVTMANYKELIPKNLGILRYPTNVNLSLMKSANTMHSWPQIISMLAWLVDFVERIETQVLFIDSKINHVILTNGVGEFKKWLDKGGTEPISTTDFKKDLTAEYEIDYGKIEDLRRKKETSSAQLNKLIEEEQKILSEIQCNENEIAKRHAADKRYCMKAEKLQEDMKKLEQLKLSVKQKDAQIASVREQIVKWEEKIRKQPYTVQMKQELIAQNDELKHAIQNEISRQEELKEIISTFDQKLSELTRKIGQVVRAKNSELTDLVVLHPPLLSLELRSSGFLDKDFRHEIQEMLKKKSEFTTAFEEQLRHVELTYKKFFETRQDLLEKLKTLKATVAKDEEMFSSKMLNKDIAIQKLDQEIASLMETTNKYKEECKQLDENNLMLEVQLQELSQKCIEDEKRNKNAMKDLDDTTASMLTFLKTMHNDIIKNYKNIKGLNRQFLENLSAIRDNTDEKYMDIIKSLETFEKK